MRISRRTEDASFISVRRGHLFRLPLPVRSGTFPDPHQCAAGGFRSIGWAAGQARWRCWPRCRTRKSRAVLATNEKTVLNDNYPALPQERIRADIEKTRQRGYSLNPGLIVPNSWGIGAVVRYPDGMPAGALSIAAIDSRMQEPRQKELGGLLIEEAGRVEKKGGRRCLHRASRRPSRRSGAIQGRKVT